MTKNTKKQEENEDDLLLWKAISETIRPLSSKAPPPEVKNVSLEKKLTLNLKPMRQETPLSYESYDDLSQGDIHFMDKKTAQRFKNGEMNIEGTLDLHGHTLKTGYEALKNFIHAQSKRNARCLLVITGKGGFLGKGVIREEMPLWINSKEIRSLILSYVHAKPKDGGEGAFYILLKRNRS